MSEQIAKRQVCAFCGEREATTIDHVPPRAIFPKPFPSDFITVPACFACNNGSSSDDEEFRAAISLNVGHDTAKTQQLWKEGLVRTLRHNQRLRSSIVDRASDIDMHSPAGIFLGKMVAVPIRATPHKRVLRRIVRGLYYHHFGELVASDVFVDANPVQSFPDELPSIAPMLALGSVGGTAFAYRYGRAADAPSASVWFMVFYERYLVFGSTRSPHEDAAPTPTN